MSRAGAVEPEAVKACCSATYSNDLVRVVLGDTYHPGGRQLTRHLARLVKIGPSSRVLDVACGPGTTALLLAEEFGARVLGIDISTDLVERATLTAAQKGLTNATFLQGDAEELATSTADFDVVMCECALSTFPAKARALSGFHRALKPGGLVGITDVSLDANRLDESLRNVLGYASCIGGALQVDEYIRMLSSTGFRVIQDEAHNEALLSMIDSIEARVKAAAILGLLKNSGLPIDRARVLELTGAARKAVLEGIAGYHLFIAERI